MSVVNCPHCGAPNDPTETAGYCDECGKKIPSVKGLIRLSGGQPVEYTAPPQQAPKKKSTTITGAGIQAAVTLWAIAAFHVLMMFLLVMFLLVSWDASVLEGIEIELGIAIGFALNGFWALWKPLPPTLIVLFLHLVLGGCFCVNGLVNRAGPLPPAVSFGLLMHLIFILALVFAAVRAATSQE
jgi:hypothetical protein